MFAVKAHFLAAWRSGFRSRSFRAVFVLSLLLIAVAWLGGAFSARQPESVALDVGLSAIRVSLILLCLFWVQSLVGNEIERRTVFFALTYPQPRWVYLLGRFAAIAALSAVAAGLLGLLLNGVVRFSSWGNQYAPTIDLGAAYWAAIALTWLEVAVIASFALWVATLSTTQFFPLVMGLAFAVSTRLLGPMIDYLLAGADGDKKLVTSYLPLLDLLRWLIPDLARLDVRAAALYGVWPEAGVLLSAAVAAVGYALMFFGLAIWALDRRQFA